MTIVVRTSEEVTAQRAGDHGIPFAEAVGV